MLWADLAYRAVPWVRLLLESRSLPRDLNLTVAQRWSIVLTGVGGVGVVLAPWRPWAGAVGLACLVAIAVLNRGFYGFLRRRRGFAFAVAAVPLHLLYFACAGVGFAYAWLEARLSRRRRRTSHVTA